MKRYLLSGMMAALLASTLARAGTDTPADSSAGRRRAAVCFACHGGQGAAALPGTPHLYGQDRAYLESALHAYRDGQTRQNAVMNAMAKPLSDVDIANIAAYFSQQKH